MMRGGCCWARWKPARRVAAIAKALPKVAYTGPRGPLQIDPATNNIVQNVYIFETVRPMPQ